MRYDGPITALWFCSSFMFSSLPRLSLERSLALYQSQLGPLAVHHINKHDGPEAHAGLLIMRVSQTGSFVIDPT